MFDDGTNTVDSTLGSKAEAVGWGLLLVWAGIAVIADLGWAAGLVGAAAILFGRQALLLIRGGDVDGLPIGVGVLLLLAATWELLAITWSLVAVLLILGGTTIIIKAVLAQISSAVRPADEPPLPL